MKKEDTDYTKLLPIEPPEGMIEYFVNKGRLDGNVLIYKAEYITEPLTGEKKKMVKLKCSACGGEEYATYKQIICCHNQYAPAPFGFYHSETGELIKSYDDILCPMCGAQVRVLHTGCFYHNEYTARIIYPFTVERIGNDVALLKWSVSKVVHKTGEIEYRAKHNEGYIFSGKKCIKITGYLHGWFSSKYQTADWNQLKRCTDTQGLVSKKDVYNLDMKKLEGTCLENSKLNIYIKSDKETYPITYLRVYQRHKNVENLVMQGASRIISDEIKIRHRRYYGSQYPSDIDGINWKEKTPHKMLGLTKAEFKTVVKNKWSASDLDFYKSAKMYGITPDNIDDCRTEGYHRVKEFFDNEYENNIPRALRYLKKQRQLLEKKGINITINIRYLLDTWKMKEKLGEDLTQLSERYPQNLVNAHDTALRMQKYDEDEELVELFADRYNQLLKYRFSFNGLTITPARNEHELYLEGKLLGHCVHSYSNRHANGKTAIFFIRKQDEPETPYFTLELDEKSFKVLQNRGYKNCGRTDDVVEFEEKWLEHIKEICEKEKKHGKRNNDKVRKSA